MEEELSNWRILTKEEYTNLKNKIAWHPNMNSLHGQRLTTEEAFILVSNNVTKGIDKHEICGKLCDRIGINREPRCNHLSTGVYVDYYCINRDCIVYDPIDK